VSAASRQQQAADKQRLQTAIDDNLRWFGAMRAEFEKRQAELVAIAKFVQSSLEATVNSSISVPLHRHYESERRTLSNPIVFLLCLCCP
jgi:hypothetical protein